MCGIAGIVELAGSRPDEATLYRMCSALAHRGPDDRAVEVNGPAGLGMTRLAVIDVTDGRQPYSSEDGSITAVFNGEIYNFRELRAGLESRGHQFASAADGEVIVHLWEEEGPRALERLEGMFALAVHDQRSERVWLARDRIGIKPLFAAVSAQRIVFGSEIKALLIGGVDRTPDHRALDEFLTWEYVPAPRTLFQAAEKIPAGGLMAIGLRDGSVERTRWWRLDVEARAAETSRGDIDEETLVREADDRIARAVRAQLVSDVPLGAFLSGGVDSSLVVAHMPRPATFSIGFDDPSYDELRWAGRVAEHLGTKHHTQVLKAEAGDMFGRLMQFMEDPIADVSIFPTYLVSRLAREHVTVALSGDGGDELFGGYESYVAQEAERLWRRCPSFVRRAAAHALTRSRPRPAKKGWWNLARRFAQGAVEDRRLEHARWRLFLSSEVRRQLYTDDLLAEVPDDAGRHVRELFEEAGSLPPTGRRLYVDMNSYLVDNCLVKVDRMSMACSLEVRVPFLDRHVVEFATGLPDRMKLSGRVTKPLLKRTAARHVPADCIYRPKEGFSIPMKHWLRGELRPLVEDLLSAERIRAEGRFRCDTVERLKREHFEGSENHSHLLWALLVFEDWRDRWAA
ncbi:MAG: asparagine synthase (glutamine-hydrolyzing) [Gemmatimonadota bacterium]